MTHPSQTDEIVARCLEEVARCMCVHDMGDNQTHRNLLLRAKVLRTPTPTSAPPSGELYSPRMNDGWRWTDFERNTAAERICALAKRIGYINGRKGHYGDHCAYEKVIREELADEWNEALSSLDRTGGGT